MRKFKLVVVTIAMATLIAMGCGGENGGGGTGPSASSAKTAAFVWGTFIFTGATYLLISLDKLNPGLSPEVVCTWNGDDFDCTIYDDQSNIGEVDHNCVVVGTLTGAAGDNDFNADYDCTGFQATSDATFDGVFAVSLQTGEAINISASAGKGMKLVSKQANTTCDINDGDTQFDFEGDTCTWNSSSTPECEIADANLAFELIVDQGGVNVTDPCGPYQLGENATLTSTLCVAADLSSGTQTANLNGSYNGSTVNADYNITCQ